MVFQEVHFSWYTGLGRVEMLSISLNPSAATPPKVLNALNAFKCTSERNKYACNPDMEVPNMPASPEMEVPNMPASPEMEVPNMDSSSDHDDNGDFGDNEEDNPNIVPDQNLQLSVPIENYVRDIDNLDDFANHWVWQIQDTEASFTPFTGTPGLFQNPPNTKPVDFFNLLFECKTNRYAESKMQGKFSILHKFISVHLKSTFISSMCKLINKVTIKSDSFT